MNLFRIAGIVLIAAGILALVFGGFTWTKSTHEVDLGPLEFEARRKERLNVPVWASAAIVLAGIGLLFVGNRRR